jgi:ABC-2 type transport system ATP-binding protein
MRMSGTAQHDGAGIAYAIRPGAGSGAEADFDAAQLNARERRNGAVGLASPAVHIRGLRHRYGDAEVLGGLDLDVRAGEVYALLGPNGAGKTTTVEILAGFVAATAGEVRVLGTDPAAAPVAWRDRIGIVLQESESDPGLTVEQALELYAGYHSHPRDVGETLALVGLAEQSGRPATTLSGGQRRRLDLALAVIGEPTLLFLDEPTTGFDPAARRVAWDVIDGLRDQGKTILLTTHQMEEAERLADRIGVIVAGRLVAEGPPDTLGGRDRAASEITFRLSGEPAGRRRRLASTRPLEDLEQLSSWAREHGCEVRDLDVRRTSLEDVYLRLTTNKAN